MAVVQNPSGAPSRPHSTLETASLGANVKLALVCEVGFAGAAARVTPIVNGSSPIIETEPVAAAAENGGKTGLLCEDVYGEVATT